MRFGEVVDTNVNCFFKCHRPTLIPIRAMGVFIICPLGGGGGGGARNFVCPRSVVITWHGAVECLVSVSNCVIYILPLLLSCKYDDSVVFYVFIFLSVAQWGGEGARGRPLHPT